MSLILKTQDANDPHIDEEHNQIYWPLNFYEVHSDIENDDAYLTESDYFESAGESESEESLDNEYDPLYKTKNCLN
jgi:hypothetical protein